MTQKEGTFKHTGLVLLFVAFCMAFSFWAAPDPSSVTFKTHKDNDEGAVFDIKYGVDQGAAIDDAFKSLARRKPWGSDGEKKNDYKSTDWHFRGVVIGDNTLLALIEIDGKIKICQQGDPLPSGETLSGIESDSVRVSSEKGEKLIKLYQTTK